MTRKFTLNDDDRAQWIETTLEGWHAEQRRSGLGMRAFVRAHRAELDADIMAIMTRPPATPGAF